MKQTPALASRSSWTYEYMIMISVIGYISCLLLCNITPKFNSLYLLTHSFWGSGIQVWLMCVLCLRASLELTDKVLAWPVPSQGSAGGKSTSRLTHLTPGQLQHMMVSCWLLARELPQLLAESVDQLMTGRLASIRESKQQSQRGKKEATVIF